jgi:hypothetical protein
MCMSRLVRTVVLLVVTGSVLSTLGCVKHFRDYADAQLPTAHVALLQMRGAQLVAIDGAKEDWYRECGSCDIEVLPGAHTLTVEGVVPRRNDTAGSLLLRGLMNDATQTRVEFTARAGCGYSLDTARQRAGVGMKMNKGAQVGPGIEWAPEVVEHCGP